ncbi:MAG: RsmB/NOP family class I SAM-dependent RNA methyltransferase [Lentisphaeria bacterium]|nr:RsmB/NOP family class I SAM-dependent RNA methyltransferase [Lentisphaeria bacterium]
MTNKDLDNLKLARRADHQARVCAEAFRQVAESVFFAGRPADRSLNYFFRNNRQIGSRDRRFITDTVFAAFRWWGACLGELAARERELFDHRFAVCDSCLEGGGWPDFQAAVRCLHVAGELDHLPDTPPRLALRRLAETDPRPRETAAEPLFPIWMDDHLAADVDRKTLAEWLQSRPPMWLRLQTDKIEETLAVLRAENLDPVPHARLKNAVSVGYPHVNLHQLASFRDGLYDVQDLASQAIGAVCDPTPGQRWWDACAGAGGKSLQLASAMRRKGTVVASDVRPHALQDLTKRARRAGFLNIDCEDWDGKDGSVKQAAFDGVLVDAPCTCSGTWRRNPAARWQLPEADIRKMADLQFEIARRVFPALRPAGRLVFATCSMFKEENEDNVQRILAALPVELEPFPHPLTGVETPGFLQIWPWEGDSDAMFVARFRKTADAGSQAGSPET